MFGCRVRRARDSFFFGAAVPVLLVTIFSLGFGCSDGDAVSSLVPTGGVTTVGGGQGGGTAGEAGSGGTTEVGTGGASTAGAGGAATQGGGGGGAGDENGSGGTAGDAGGSAMASDAEAGPMPDGGPNPLTLCLRLASPSKSSFDVTYAFEHAIVFDCRLKWVSRLYLDLDERAQFVTGMLQWNLDVWGGPTATEPTDFALLYKPASLTPEEADTLVDEYVAAADVTLALGSDEKQQMRSELRRLAQQHVDASTSGFPRSVCTDASATDGAADAGSAGDGS